MSSHPPADRLDSAPRARPARFRLAGWVSMALSLMMLTGAALVALGAFASAAGSVAIAATAGALFGAFSHHFFTMSEQTNDEFAQWSFGTFE